MCWLVAQQSDHAEKIGQGASSAFDGLSGLFSDIAGSAQWGRWIGYILAIALGLWLLRKLGILRG